ncbi:hypothetical protein [Nostoc cycadae]|nr:hypothetical protein [Nostoc cycadae]
MTKYSGSKLTQYFQLSNASDSRRLATAQVGRAAHATGSSALSTQHYYGR